MRDISNHHSKHSKDSSNTSTDNCNCDMILPINSHQLHHSNSFNFNNYSNFSFSSLDHFLMSNALSPDQNHQTLSNKKRKKLSAEESFNLPYPSLSKEIESAESGLSTENIVSGGKINGVNGYNFYGGRNGEKLRFNQNLAQVQPTENYAEKLELPELNRQGSEMSDYKPLNLRAQYSIGSEFAEYQPFNQRFNSLKQENNDNVYHERKQQDVYDVNGEQGKQKTQVIPIENWTLSSEVSKPNKPHIGKHFNLEQLQSQKQIYHKESAEAHVIAPNNPHKTRRTSQMTNASSKNSNADLENQTANVEFEPTHVQMTGPKAKSRLNPIKNSASKLKKLGFTSSEYNGVCWNKRKEKWRARFNYNGKREFLGDFDTQEEAAHAFDKRIREVYPKSKQLERLNFIDGKRNVPNPSI